MEKFFILALPTTNRYQQLQISAFTSLNNTTFYNI